MGQVMVIVSWLAALGLAGAGVLGYRGVDGEEAVRQHVLFTLATLLVLVLAHSWVLFYLLGMVRIAREEALRAGRPELLGGAFSGFRSRALPWIIAAPVSGLACFVLGASAYAGWASPLLHVGLFYLCLGCHAVASGFEWRLLHQAEAAVAALDR